MKESFVAAVAISTKFSSEFPGYAALHAPGVGFDRDCECLTISKGSLRLGALFLTYELLSDNSIDEVLREIKRYHVLETLRTDKPTILGNSGVVE